MHKPDANGFSNNVGGGQAFTLAAWIEPDAMTGPIITRTGLDIPRGKGLNLMLKDGKLQLHMVGANGIGWMDMDSGHVETVDAVVPNGRHHVTATYDGSRQIENVFIYVDGKPVKLKVLHNNIGPFNPTQDSLRVGAGGGAERFRGEMWDVRTYEIALTADRVAALAEPASLAEIAAVPPDKRTKPQADKIDSYFLEHQASIWVEQDRAEQRRKRIATATTQQERSRQPPPATVDKIMADLRAARREKEDFEDTLPTDDGHAGFAAAARSACADSRHLQPARRQGRARDSVVAAANAEERAQEPVGAGHVAGGSVQSVDGAASR